MVVLFGLLDRRGSLFKLWGRLILGHLHLYLWVCWQFGWVLLRYNSRSNLTMSFLWTLMNWRNLRDSLFIHVFTLNIRPVLVHSNCLNVFYCTAFIIWQRLFLILIKVVNILTLELLEMKSLELSFLIINKDVSLIPFLISNVQLSELLLNSVRGLRCQVFTLIFPRILSAILALLTSLQVFFTAIFIIQRLNVLLFDLILRKGSLSNTWYGGSLWSIANLCLISTLFPLWYATALDRKLFLISEVLVILFLVLKISIILHYVVIFILVVAWIFFKLLFHLLIFFIFPWFVQFSFFVWLTLVRGLSMLLARLHLTLLLLWQTQILIHAALCRFQRLVIFGGGSLLSFRLI